MNNKTKVLSRVARDNNLDLLRLMACVAVVGLHTLQKDISVINSSLYYLCGFAVPVFFMASGYILLQRKNIDFSYSFKKILAIIKFTFLWNFIIAIVKILLYAINSKLNFSSVVKIVMDYPKGFLQSGTFWHFWYFGALIIIYALLPVIYKYCCSKKNIQKVWIILLCICILVQLGSYIVHHPLQSYIRQSLRVWSWFQYFFLGGVLAWNKNALVVRGRYLNFWLVFISVTVVIEQNVLGRVVLNNLYAEYFYDDIITILWCGVIFLWGMRIKLSDKMNNMVLTLAPLTLGVYVIHPLIRNYVNSHYAVDTLLLSLIYFVGMLMVSFVFTFILKKMKLLALIELR